MEFLIILVIVGIVGGALGYFAGKKYQPEKNRKIKAGLLFVVLGLSVYAALTISKVYLACVVLIAGELIGMAIPKRNK